MANGINKVILIGNLGRDPEIQRLDSGVKRATFTIATTESYKNKEGQKVDHTEWHNIVLWRGLADIAESYLKKGNTVYIEGKIRKRDYDDKDGIKRYITEIIGDNLTMLGGPRREGSGDDYAPSKSETSEVVPETPSQEDDLPF